MVADGGMGNYINVYYLTIEKNTCISKQVIIMFMLILKVLIGKNFMFMFEKIYWILTFGLILHEIRHEPNLLEFHYSIY
jgi:hypothetical protein